jgi:hypothetical protein
VLGRSGFTVEALAYGLIVAAGLALRLHGLGQAPLEPTEARLALAAWNMTHGAQPAAAGAPLAVFATALVVFVFGASDAAVRLLPALAGGALPLAAWALRRPCGRWAALAVATALALAPTLVAAGRRAEPAALAVGLAALLLVAVAARPPRWPLAALAGGALAACGPAGFLALTALALGALWVAWRAGWRTWRIDGRLLALGLVASLLAATGGLLAPAGWGLGVWQPFVTWLLGVGNPLPALRAYARELVLHDPAVLLLVLLALLLARRRALAGLPLWLAGGVVLLAALASVTRTAPDAALPLVVAALAAAAAVALAAELAAALARPHAAAAAIVLHAPEPSDGRHVDEAAASATPRADAAGGQPLWPAVGYALLSLALGLWLVTLVLSSATLPGGPPRVFNAPITGYFVLTLALVLLVGIAGFQTLGVARARLTLLIAGLALAFMLGLHSATWGPVLAAGGPAAQAGLQTTSGDLRNLVAEVERHAAVWATPGRRDVPLYLDPAVELPLGWYVRAYGERPARPEEARLAIRPAAARRPAGRWVERRYRLATVGAAPAVEDLWRWQLYRERPGPSAATDVVLYVRMD